MKSGILNFLEPSGPIQACIGTDIYIYIWVWSAGGIIMMETNCNNRRETCSSVNFFITDPTQICLQSKPASPRYKVSDWPSEPCNSCVVMCCLLPNYMVSLLIIPDFVGDQKMCTSLPEFLGSVEIWLFSSVKEISSSQDNNPLLTNAEASWFSKTLCDDWALWSAYHLLQLLRHIRVAGQCIMTGASAVLSGNRLFVNTCLVQDQVYRK